MSGSSKDGAVDISTYLPAEIHSRIGSFIISHKDFTAYAGTSRNIRNALYNSDKFRRADIRVIFEQQYRLDDLKDYILRSGPDDIRNDPVYVGIAVAKDTSIYANLSDELKKSTLLVQTVFAEDKFQGHELLINDQALRSNAKLVMAAVQQDGVALEYASDNLKDNPEVVIAAVQEKGLALMYASDNLKNNLKVVMAAVQENGVVLSFASDNLKNDYDVVMAAVKENGEALRFASDNVLRAIADGVRNIPAVPPY